MEVERVASAVSSLDAAVLTAKAGAAVVAAKVAFDSIIYLQQSGLRLLEVAGALAAAYLLWKYWPRQAAAAPAAPLAAAAPAPAAGPAGVG